MDILYPMGIVSDGHLIASANPIPWVSSPHLRVQTLPFEEVADTSREVHLAPMGFSGLRAVSFLPRSGVVL